MESLVQGICTVANYNYVHIADERMIEVLTLTITHSGCKKQILW